MYPESTSDKDIVWHCGILNLMEPGDLINGDKGFLIQHILPPNVYLNLPPFWQISSSPNNKLNSLLELPNLELMSSEPPHEWKDMTYTIEFDSEPLSVYRNKIISSCIMFGDFGKTDYSWSRKWEAKFLLLI